MSNSKWACFHCRMTLNREHQKCPTCSDELHDMGQYFKPPKLNKDKEWEAILMLYDAGVRYGSTSRSTLSSISLFREKGIPTSNYELLKFIPTALYHLNATITKSMAGRKPKHPREVKDYLDSIEKQKHDLIADVHKACDKLGRERPDVKRFLARFQKIITQE